MDRYDTDATWENGRFQLETQHETGTQWIGMFFIGLAGAANAFGLPGMGIAASVVLAVATLAVFWFRGAGIEVKGDADGFEVIQRGGPGRRRTRSFDWSDVTSFVIGDSGVSSCDVMIVRDEGFSSIGVSMEADDALRLIEDLERMQRAAVATKRERGGFRGLPKARVSEAAAAHEEEVPQESDEKPTKHAE